EATGAAPLAYTWLFNSNAIASATGPTYTLTNLKKPNEGVYQVMVTDASGSVTSAGAQVYVVTSDFPSIETDLVARYNFDDNVQDATGRGNDGDKVGVTGRTVSGKIGGSSVVVSTASDGSGFNYVTLFAPSDFEFGSTTDFSVAFWVQPSTNTTGEFPLLANRDFSSSTNQGWAISMGADGSLHWSIAGAPGAPKNFSAPATLNDGAWHHIAVTFQRSGNASTWLDGAMIGTVSLAASANDVGTIPGLALNVGQDGTGVYNVNGAGINSPFDDIGIWRRALTAEEIGWVYSKGARHVGIEENVFNLAGAQATKVTGQWDFDGGNLKATLGQDLEYGDGPGGYQEAQTSFGTTTSFGIADIGGQAAKVLKYTRSETPPDNYVPGYTMHHGIAPNGGGTLVNQWTLVTDILIPKLTEGGSTYTAVIEIQNDPGSDADISIHEESPGVGGIGISGDYPGNITAGQWHRIVVAVDMSAAVPVISKFVDGVKAGDQINASDRGLDKRFSLSDVAHLFSDGGHDNEVTTLYVNSVQIRSGKLSDDDAAALGGPQASGIPMAIPTGGGTPVTTQPKLKISVSEAKLTISWDATVTGFTLESTTSLISPTWTAVTGVSNNSVTVDVAAGAKFYRLKK
ncbi:MAG TPA: LamG domain-containing protein, partial [Verrucomicrobiae bacterium]|nr:LamG domain-containing protein [Verrucomicrobiae bacterium]